MGTAVLQACKLCKTFSTGGIQQHVLKNLDLSIGEGDFTVIMGSSGSGKSTLLYALSGMDTPTLGDIFYGKENIARLKQDQLARFRRKSCGFLFQQIYLLDTMSVLDNILACGLLVSKNRRETESRARELLHRVGLDEAVWRKFPSQISGGEAQRAGIVRALINEPHIIFADEPTGALNSTASTSVLDVLTQVNTDGQSIVMVTHDMKSALRGNRILYLKDGVICGECLPGPYQGSDKARHEKVNAFLAEMGW